MSEWMKEWHSELVCEWIHVSTATSGNRMMMKYYRLQKQITDTCRCVAHAAKDCTKCFLWWRLTGQRAALHTHYSYCYNTFTWNWCYAFRQQRDDVPSELIMVEVFFQPATKTTTDRGNHRNHGSSSLNYTLLHQRTNIYMKKIL